MASLFVVIAGLAGFAGVALGALSDHGVSGDLAAQALLDTASRYLLLHAAALLALGGHLRHDRVAAPRMASAAGLLFVLGMLLFGGGLTIHALTGIAAVAVIVPVGGTAFMLGWLVLAAYGMRLIGRVVD
jgi:uncharacterized membrane protein YgdD (TMEM256/DUF423 family)